MIIKLVILLAALKLHDLKNDPIPPTVLYVVAFVIAALISGANLIHVLVLGVITFCVTLVYFALLSKFPDGLKYYLIMVFGGAFLILVI
ncbi:hypothetical protein [Aliiglaciecola lipolytica]|uniref:Membrane protein n=1 Tax=Aliiglaciecola lipolytica E3 TaxID=1127673 RepID=K6X6G3_9ALTE|nr:hypothetical protein [Aliiglaciecola lipolytica]GAC16209.1 membrane protein [Aliiglaciecola lipolytica E3]